MTNWATIGLFIAPTGLQGGDQSLSGPSVPEGLSREVADDRVEYTYSLGEFRGRNVTTQLRGSLKSESTCTGWAILNNTVHIGGVENGTFTGENVSNLSRNSSLTLLTEDFELIYEPLRRFGPNVRQDTVIWTAPTDGNNFRNPSSCLTTCKPPLRDFGLLLTRWRPDQRRPCQWDGWKTTAVRGMPRRLRLRMQYLPIRTGKGL